MKLKCRTALFAGVALAMFAVSCAAQQVGRRVSPSAPKPITPGSQKALVIGNDSYSSRALHTSVNDATDVAARLGEFGYQVVLRTNLGRRAMAEAIEQFAARLETGDAAFFYYSGYAVRREEQNYLLPVDFAGHDDIAIRYDSIPAGLIQERMEKSPAQLNILVIDSRQDESLPASERGGSGDLAAMAAARGTFLAIATGPGQAVSETVAGRNGLFAKHLLKALAGQDLDLGAVFRNVRTGVYKDSGGKQLPWTLNGVVGTYSFVRANSAPVASVPDVAEVPPNLPPSPALSPEIESIIKTGDGHLEEGKFDLATADYTEVLRLKPDFAAGFYRRGLAYQNKGDYDRAIRDYTEAIRLNPGFWQAVLGRGLSHAAKARDKANSLNPLGMFAWPATGTPRHEYALALDDFERVIRLKPDAAEAFLARGRYCRYARKYDCALENYAEAIRLRPDYTVAFYESGLVHTWKHNYDAAIGDYGEVIRRDPTDASAFAGRGLCYLRKKDYPRAIQDYTEALRLQPDSGDYREGLEQAQRKGARKSGD